MDRLGGFVETYDKWAESLMGERDGSSERQDYFIGKIGFD
jgi:hypothetical protein